MKKSSADCSKARRNRTARGPFAFVPFPAMPCGNRSAEVTMYGSFPVSPTAVQWMTAGIRRCAVLSPREGDGAEGSRTPFRRLPVWALSGVDTGSCPVGRAVSPAVDSERE